MEGWVLAVEESGRGWALARSRSHDPDIQSMSQQDPKIGLLVGREWSFPPAFIEEVNGRDAGVVAEYVRVGAPRMDEEVPYAVIIDRISHEVPFYRSFLKSAILRGAKVVNDPFTWAADDKFYGATLATRLGVASPKTAVLPHKAYAPGIVHDESLRNLEYPLDWQGVLDYVGLPCVLKNAHGGRRRDVQVCQSLEELLLRYNQSGRQTMIVQEYIEWEDFVRCICLGRSEVLAMQYDPRERRYLVGEGELGSEVESRVVDATLTLMRALGYDMCSLEFAIRDGVPYAVDFMNPVPDMDINSLTPHYFNWVVSHMADLAIRLALQPEAAGTGRSDRDAAGDLAEELPSLARDLTTP
jgi:hypothetical protein